MLSISTTKIQKNSYFFTISPSLLKTNNIFFSGNVWGVREKCLSLHKENNNNLNLETMINMSNPKIVDGLRRRSSRNIREGHKGLWQRCGKSANVKSCSEWLAGAPQCG